MNAARYYYSQDAIELIIVKIEPSDDDPYYEIKTKKLVKLKTFTCSGDGCNNIFCPSIIYYNIHFR